MKILAFFLLIGLASASFQENLDDTNEDVLSLWEKQEKEFIAFADQAEDEVKTELGRTLKEGLDRLLEKIKDAVKEGKTVKKDVIEKVKEIRDRLRTLKEELGEKTKKLVEDIKEMSRDYFKKVLERLGLGKRSMEVRQSDLNLDDALRKIKEHIKNNIDPELLKEKIEKIFGQGREIVRQFLKTLKEKGRRKLEILIDALLGEDEERESRSIKDYWEKIKDYFKDLKINLKEKYMKFGEWVKERYGKGMEVSKDKMENIKAIAKEFVRNVKNVSKEVGAEASDFFNDYKEELKDVWEEMKEAFKQIKNRQD